MKILSVSGAKASLGRVIDQVIKTRQPVLISRRGRHVIIVPYDLPTPDVIEIARISREADQSVVSVGESKKSLNETSKAKPNYKSGRTPRKNKI